ncbi:MAG: D-alanyl-D-alanine carboxypeptidase, partial [Oscillospiraceae bacterium]|nr:D-alanyl-D-alanine carboxypeptidase [Oscillospiraceae bacterium]
GDVLTAEQLVEAMMLPSGNDASYLLACEVGRVIKQNPQLGASAAVGVFMSQLNSQAASLGMTGTHFVNPDGIHDKNHYTTFGDLAILGKLAMADKTVMKYAVKAKDQVTLHGETIDWKNTNKLIDPASSYYCPYAVGLKTGQTPDAGSCLLSAFRFRDQELLIGVFGCPREDDRFDDTLQLFNQIVLK